MHTQAYKRARAHTIEFVEVTAMQCMARIRLEVELCHLAADSAVWQWTLVIVKQFHELDALALESKKVRLTCRMMRIRSTTRVRTAIGPDLL